MPRTRWGCKSLEAPPGLPDTPGESPPGAQPGEQPLAFQGPAGHRLPGEAGALQNPGGHGLGAGDKGDAGPVARHKLPGHRQAREQVAAGAPGGDDYFKFRVSSFEFQVSRQSCTEKIDLTQRRQGAEKDAQNIESSGRDSGRRGLQESPARARSSSPPGQVNHRAAVGRRPSIGWLRSRTGRRSGPALRPWPAAAPPDA